MSCCYLNLVFFCFSHKIDPVLEGILGLKPDDLRKRMLNRANHTPKERVMLARQGTYLRNKERATLGVTYI